MSSALKHANDATTTGDDDVKERSNQKMTPREEDEGREGSGTVHDIMTDLIEPSVNTFENKSLYDSYTPNYPDDEGAWSISSSDFSFDCSGFDEKKNNYATSHREQDFNGVDEDESIQKQPAMMMTAIDENNKVCFRKRNHYGTVQWRQVVKHYASDTDKYPQWSDDIDQLVRNHLHQEFGIDEFLICRDDNGKPSKTINGKWSLATCTEILDRTKQRFLDERKILHKAVVVPTAPETEIAMAGIGASSINNKNEKTDGQGRPPKRPRWQDYGIVARPDLDEVPTETPLSPTDLVRHLQVVVSSFRTATDQMPDSEQLLMPAELQSGEKSHQFLQDLKWTNQFLQQHIMGGVLPQHFSMLLPRNVGDQKHLAVSRAKEML